MTKYRRRIADDILKLKLSAMGAVLVEGAKWCGKTTTCEQQAKSVLYMDDPDTRSENLKTAELNISKLLLGEKPRLIDEWQDAPQFWDAVRFKVDHEEGEGQFILTGSSVPPRVEKISHSGTGRIARLKMRPMSLWESGESSGEVSLRALFLKEQPATASSKHLSLEEIAFVICRGGWPQTIGRTGERALITAQEYVNGLAESDVSRVDNIPRDPERVRLLLRSYARLQGAPANNSALNKDMMANDLSGLNENTISSYISALKKIFVIENLGAWSPNLRSKGSIRTTPTCYFVDPSIAAEALSIGPGNLMDDLKTLGFFFEDLAIRDLRIYVESLQGYVDKYRDKTGLECDAVLHLPNGQYALVEIKLGGDNMIDQGVETLKKLESLIQEKKLRLPAFKMVLTATGNYSYIKNDTVICPISCLKN
ncbi:ATP-binding protein [bacterium]|nr:ATP-binding protein [bacterium]